MKLGDAREGTWSRSVDPGVALLEEVHRLAGDVAYFQRKVSELEEVELVWGTVVEVHEERSGGQGGDYTLVRKESKAQLHAWGERLDYSRKQLATVAATALKAGVEERRVRLAEKGLDALEAGVMRALVRLGHDGQDPEVRAVVGECLREVVQAVFAQPQTALEGSVVDAVVEEEGGGERFDT